MELKIFLIVISICIFVSTKVQASSNESILCESCIDLHSAEQVAKSYPPKLQCSPTFNEDLYCASTTAIINLINPIDGKAYSFSVYHKDVAPWDIVAKSEILNNDAKYVYKQVALFHKNLIDSIDRVITKNTLIEKSYQITETSSNYCPSDTALNTLSDPNKLERLKSVITAEIGLNLISTENESNLSPRAYSSGYGLAYRGLNYNVNYQPQGRKPVYVKTYTESENNGSLKDALAFFVNILGYDNNRMPIIDLELSNASRVAGFTLSGLKGENGPLTIDNQCIQDKLDQLVNLGVLTMESTPINGGGSFQPNCTIIDFYQSGRHLYTFRKC
jgi:hypothetical protein